MEDRFEKRCDDIYFPFDARLSGLDSHVECKAPASTDKHLVASIDTTSTPDTEPLIQNKMESMHEELNELSAYAYDKIGWHQDESGYARSVAGEMIPVTKDNIRKILERASLFEESHICLPEHATSFTPTKLAPEIYTKDEINEMVTGICGAQEKLGDELKTLVDDTYQPLDRGYNELFRRMAEMRTEIESMQHILEKEATTSPSIDANKATSIDVKPQTSQIPAGPDSLAEKKDEWEIAYINKKISNVYNPLNNNVDWLSTRINLLQQDLDTIRKKDQQSTTSIDICTITSIDSKFAAMENRDIGMLNDQHDFQEECSTSIDRFRMPSLDVKKPTEHLPYIAAEVDQITSKLYTAIDTM
ncbi:hypothetical protein F2Q68_00016208 [Brassica cretica]|uniref:Uncharacterized protein n=1 Tax=Brassica cretica TaxID=69181 RepID=A0A8S9HK03_BRACR|nr:hypothetical protein F2Q68_00016208 [Brassica cretica]